MTLAQVRLCNRCAKPIKDRSFKIEIKVTEYKWPSGEMVGTPDEYTAEDICPDKCYDLCAHSLERMLTRPKRRKRL